MMNTFRQQTCHISCKEILPLEQLQFFRLLVDLTVERCFLIAFWRLVEVDEVGG